MATRADIRTAVAGMVQDNAGKLLKNGSAPTAPGVSVINTLGVLTGVRLYKVTFVYPLGETAGGATSVGVHPVDQQNQLTNIPLGQPGCLARNIYGTPANQRDGTQQLVTTIGDNTTTSFVDNVPDSGLGAPVPTGQLLSDIDSCASSALAIYSEKRPNILVAEIIADFTGAIFVSTLPNFDEGFLEQTQIEYPIVPNGRPIFLGRDEWEAYRTTVGLAVRLIYLAPLGQTVRLSYRVPHVFPSDDVTALTIRASDFDALCHLAASLVNGKLASFYVQTTDNVLSDAVDYKTRRTEYEARAKWERQQYDDHIDQARQRTYGRTTLVRG